MSPRLLFVLSSFALLSACGSDAPSAGADDTDGSDDSQEDDGAGGMDAGSGDGDGDGPGDGDAERDAGDAVDAAQPRACSQQDPSGCIDELAGSQASDFGSYWKDSWFIMGCPERDKDGHDCRIIPECPNGDADDFEDRGAVVNETFPLGGEIGVTYAVTFTFNGLAEGKYYRNGEYARSDVDQATPGGKEPEVDEDGVNGGSFYVGGEAVPTNYNVMRMRVLDASREELGRYYLNAFPEGSGAESHRTFLFSYTHTIDVPGGGFVEYRFQDANCKAVDNCGAGTVNDNGPCDQGRSLPNEPDAQLPAMYSDPAAGEQPHLVPTADLNPFGGASQPWHAQLGHLTITKVVPIESK